MTALWRIPWGNPELGTALGIVYTLFGLAARAGAREAFARSEQATDPVEVLEPFVRLQICEDRIVGHVIGFEDVPDLDLRWVDGRPVVDGATPDPILVDTFTVAARPSAAAAPSMVEHR